ncbi:MBL fold metallo-hydrolase [Jiella sonneratiae]|uniref:MBL fold metallo-hydrolase n=1 Tax=Jiella sonneratiae TaxID=2816856 RepID=A0ABS3J1L1_9HYPH|nr:MBL fold metallo-hydrolase [Jiella sonneratiae]MBO0903543.1 MBL fold metallo-hydrolase [Jiella sonneratiae]
MRARPIVRVFLCLVAALWTLSPGRAFSQDAAGAGERPSQCRAIASRDPGSDPDLALGVVPAQFAPSGRGLFEGGAGDRTVRITYVTHATFLIESPGGVRAATDYAGYAGPAVPDIVTMNKAHSSHNTAFPDPAIKHVLKGWNPAGDGPARHALTVGDMYVRNVTTDIRSFGGAMEPDGNSIFIFEVAGLCIGHLGHLHHRLTDEDYAAIGRLDVLMVPVDGGMTMSQDGMGEIAERLQSRIILPMHRFSGPIDRFLANVPEFEVDWRLSDTIEVSAKTLPKRPTVIVLPGV